MIDPGSVALGALLILGLFGALVLYFFRGHRIDATGLRIVSTKQQRTPSAWTARLRQVGEALVAEKEEPKPEDLFEQAKERDPE